MSARLALRHRNMRLTAEIVQVIEYELQLRIQFIAIVTAVNESRSNHLRLYDQKVGPCIWYWGLAHLTCVR